MARHTIETLTKDIATFKSGVNLRLNTLDNSVKEFKQEIEPKVEEMHDYILTQKGIEQGKLSVRSDGTININRDVWELIIKLVLIIASIIGVGKLTS